MIDIGSNHTANEGERHHDRCHVVVDTSGSWLLRVAIVEIEDIAAYGCTHDRETGNSNRGFHIKTEEIHTHRYCNTSSSNPSHISEQHETGKENGSNPFLWVEWKQRLMDAEVTRNKLLIFGKCCILAFKVGVE